MTRRPPEEFVTDERLARVLLSRLVEPGDDAIVQSVEQFGAGATVVRLYDGELRPKAAPHLRSRVDDARPEADLAAAAAVQARFVVPGDAEWPPQLDDLDRLDRDDGTRCIGLWVRGPGDLAAICHTSVAIVGARAATAYGEYVAGEFAMGIAERRRGVVSGGAYGIDAAAHRGAIAGGGSTVAVLACGVDIAYPRGNAALLGHIRQAGLIVSEWPPGCAPMRHRFLVRNRLIAALTLGTVVVEAAARSGALSTVNRARDLDRHVMAVPGPITSTMSAGCHAVLRQPGAVCVTSAAEVIELVGEMGSDLADEQPRLVDPRDSLDLATRRVLEATPVRAAAGAARIAAVAGVELAHVGRCLGRLAAFGLVERVDAGWRVKRAPT